MGQPFAKIAKIAKIALQLVIVVGQRRTSLNAENVRT